MPAPDSNKPKTVRLQPLVLERVHKALTEIATAHGLPSPNSVAARYLNELPTREDFLQDLASARKILASLREVGSSGGSEDDKRAREIMDALLAGGELSEEDRAFAAEWSLFEW